MNETIRNEIAAEEKQPMVGYFWKGLALFLLGVIVGVIVAPIKKGVSIGNNNNIINGDDDHDDDWKEYSDEDHDYEDESHWEDETQSYSF